MLNPPLLIVRVVCLIVGLPLAGAAGNAQTPWLEAIEDRLAVTAKALGAMKPVKMTGLADIVSSTIRQLRLDEVRASLRWRVLNIFVTILCKTSPRFYLCGDGQSTNEFTQTLPLPHSLPSGATAYTSF